MKQTNISVTIVRVGADARHTAAVRAYTSMPTTNGTNVTIVPIAAVATIVTVTELTKPVGGDGGFGREAIFLNLQLVSPVTVSSVHLASMQAITA